MIMTSETSDKFFANIVLNLKIIHSKNFEPTIEYKTENPVKVQMQYRFKNHLSMKIISKISSKYNFLFAQFRTMKF